MSICAQNAFSGGKSFSEVEKQCFMIILLWIIIYPSFSLTNTHKEKFNLTAAICFQETRKGNKTFMQVDRKNELYQIEQFYQNPQQTKLI